MTGHAIDAISRIVKDELKQYFKAEAITSVEDFKHLCRSVILTSSSQSSFSST